MIHVKLAHVGGSTMKQKTEILNEIFDLLAFNQRSSNARSR
jgi:hypothetical protein